MSTGQYLTHVKFNKDYLLYFSLGFLFVWKI